MATPQEIIHLLEQLDHCVKNWPRGSGLLLDLISEKLKTIQKNFIEEVTAALPDDVRHKINDDNASATLSDQNEPEIFVALYQVDGTNLDKWAQTLSTIAFQGVFRPIYGSEAAICKMIQGKENRTREGYAVIRIDPSAIIASPKENLDKLGSPLFHIKPGSLQSKNIKRFVHMSGQYLWQNNTLIKLDLPVPLHGI